MGPLLTGRGRQTACITALMAALYPTLALAQMTERSELWREWSQVHRLWRAEKAAVEIDRRRHLERARRPDSKGRERPRR